jgi:hypothetical protein
LKCGVGLLRRGEIAELQGLAERAKGLRDRIAPQLGGASSVMMSEVVCLPRRLLGILLDRGEVLLCKGSKVQLGLRCKSANSTASSSAG